MDMNFGFKSQKTSVFLQMKITPLKST